MTKSADKIKTTIQTLQNTHEKSTIELFVKAFCDSEPLTKHLKITYKDYEPFANEVVKKAIKDGMSVVALDENNRVIACTIGEDITDPFHPVMSKYPKMGPIFAFIDTVSEPFLSNKKFVKGKIDHIWISITHPEFRGQGLSTKIDMACAELAAKKGFEFSYTEFTNVPSEKIAHHYPVNKLMNTVKFEEFTWKGQTPFKGLKGESHAYLIGIKPGIKLDALQHCYK